MRLSTAVPEHAIQHLITATFPDARARARLPGSRDDYELPFGAPKRPSKLLWVPNCETVRFRWLHPLRSLVPPASPFTPDQVALDRRSILFWASAPLKLSPPTPRILKPARAQGFQATPRHPKAPLRNRERHSSNLARRLQLATWRRPAHLGPKASADSPRFKLGT